jgi:mRNA-degrading endonuclease toxin of MazEF toxin-antitoxin module
MSFNRFQKPTSVNIVFTGPNQSLSPDALQNVSNRNKMLYNDADGNISFIDPIFLDEILPFATLAAFPPVGDSGKLYLDESNSKLYRYVSGSYYYVPHDVYSKVETDGKYRLISDSYTKSETDTKYVIRASTTNDMTGSQINNLNVLSVANSITANQTAVTVSKPLQLGWNNIDFVGIVNGKIKLDGTGIILQDDVTMGTKNITTTGNVTATNITTISTNLAAEVTNRTNANALLVPYTGATGAVNLGSQNLTTTGNVTATNITTISTNLATETTNRTNADLLLIPYTGATTNVNLGIRNLTTTGNVTATNITTIASDLATETTNRTNADALLVPYTGASSAVNLGSQNLTTTGTTTLSTLKLTTLQNSSGTNSAVVTSQGFLDFVGTSSSTGGVRFGSGKVSRETNEGKVFYNAVGNCLHLIGCNDNSTWANDNNIRMSDNVVIDNNLSAGGTLTVTGTTTMATANITTAAVSGTATCNAVTCNTNLVVGGNINTIGFENYCVSFSQDFTVAATGYQTYTCSVPAGKNYRIVSAMWRSVTTTYLQPETNVDTNEFQRGSDTQSFLYINSIVGIVLRCTLVMDRNGP